MKHTDYRAVRELAMNILADDRKMITLTDELEQALKTLEGSFLDDGIDEVKEFVNGLKKRLAAAQGSFMTIAGELQTYANYLEAGK